MEKNNEILGMKIFTVDDESYNTFLIEQLLDEVGIKNVTQFRQASKLIETLENTDVLPDLIISDILMPKMSGYDLILAVKGNEEWKHIPIIIVTAVSVDVTDHLKQSFEAGAMDFIRKPINEIELVARVRSALTIELQRKKLEKAISEVNTLQGMLPICSYCKKIRDDKDYWTGIETYISNHSATQFSHSICPDCYEKYVKPELDAIKREKKSENNSS